jgi:hypothetical protein
MAKASLSPYMPTNSRVRLDGPHSLVKATQRGLLEDDSVPPVLTFSDVALLHQALSRSRRLTDISYLTYMSHAYAGAVRDRRRMNLATKSINGGLIGRERAVVTTPRMTIGRASLRELNERGRV